MLILFILILANIIFFLALYLEDTIPLPKFLRAKENAPGLHEYPWSEK